VRHDRAVEVEPDSDLTAEPDTEPSTEPDPGAPADRVAGTAGERVADSGNAPANASGGAPGTGEVTSGARPHHGNRYGRSERARQAVLNAADDLLVERGFAGVTIEGIAAKAGVAKQTIYRWWSSKTEVLMDAYLEDAAEDLVPADHGDLESDLRGYLCRLTQFLVGTDPGEVFRALIGQAQHDPEIATAFRGRCVDEQRDRDRLLIERAVSRGELPRDLDVATTVDQLVGPIYYRILVTGQEVDRAFIDALVDGFLRQTGFGERLGAEAEDTGSTDQSPIARRRKSTG
jgi:AcrR family transcriptional regulator